MRGARLRLGGASSRWRRVAGFSGGFGRGWCGFESVFGVVLNPWSGWVGSRVEVGFIGGWEACWVLGVV